MSDDALIDVDDGSWESAQTLAAAYGAEFRRRKIDLARCHHADPMCAVHRRAAHEAEEMCIRWSYTAFNRWVGSPDWADWHEERRAKDGQVIEGN